MIFKYQRSNACTTLEYVTNILTCIKDIKSFEVFRDSIDSPFVSIEDGKEKRYSFMIKDKENNELWLDTLCGYGGGSPGETESILQILGLRDDYRITIQNNDHIYREELEPNHSLNLLLMSRRESPIFLAKMNFKQASDRWACLKAIQCFGTKLGIDSDDEDSKIFPSLGSVKFINDYAINNKLFLDRCYAPDEINGFTAIQLQTLLKSIIFSNHGLVNFFEICQEGLGGIDVHRFEASIISENDEKSVIVMAKDHRNAVHQIKDRLKAGDIVAVDGNRATIRYKIGVDLSAYEMAVYNY